MSVYKNIFRMPLAGALALALGGLLALAPATQAQVMPASGAACGQCGRVHGSCTGPGCHNKCNGAGFQGFGLGYHLGYGYGGCAFGTGPNGGYPFYSGPGYPHPAPCLNRCSHRVVPFPYYGGPGGPSPGQPQYYGAVGPLAPDQPVVTVGTNADYPGDFGSFTGTLPYSEEYLAPFTTRAAEAGSRSGVSSPTPEMPNTPPPANAAPPFSSPAVPSPNPPGAAAAVRPRPGLMAGTPSTAPARR